MVTHFEFESLFDTLDLIQNDIIESVHDWTRDIPIIENLINPTPF